MNLIKKIFSISLLIFSFIFLLYVFYKSQVYWKGENNSYYLFYHFTAIIFFIISILLFFLKGEVKTYLLILVVSSFFSIYLFEGFLVYNQSKIEKNNNEIKTKIYKDETGKTYDTRSKLDIYMDLSKKGEEIVVGSYPRENINYLNKNFQSFFPLSGVSNTNTIYCNENGYMSIDKTDRYGFNNPDEAWKKENIDFLIIGDSYAQGACVNRPNDIASNLRNISNKNVINLGYGGNGPLIEYATLREYLPENTKNIFWLYTEFNDLENMKEEKNSEILMKYLQDENYTQNLKIKQEYIDQVVLKIIEDKKEEKINKGQNMEFMIKNFIKLTNSRTILNKYLPDQFQPKLQTPKKLLNEFKEIMILAKKLAEKNNSKIYFVYLPEYNRYLDNYNETSFFIVKKIIKEINITFIDIHKEVFEKEKNPLKLFPFEMPGHYTAEGYRKIGQVLYNLSK